MIKEALNIVQSIKVSNSDVVGIVRSKDWWKDVEMKPLNIVLPNDYVVGTWIEYKNPVEGEPPFREAFTTISICRTLEDAVILMNSRKPVEIPETGEQLLDNFLGWLEGLGADPAYYYKDSKEIIQAFIKETDGAEQIINYIELGKRFKVVSDKLDELGVFYGKNYSGKYHEEFPHSGYWFALHLDKHRGGFESIIYHDGDPHISVNVYDGSSQSASEMIVELLEKSYDTIINKLAIKEGDEE